MFHEEPKLSTVVLDRIVDIIFFIDICLTFRTAAIDRLTNILVTDSKVIARQYLSAWFWIDLTSTIPFDEIVQAISGVSTKRSAQLRSLKLLRILRISRLFRLRLILKSQGVKDFLEKIYVSPSIVSACVLLAQIFLVAHIIACFWFFLANPFVTGYYGKNNPLSYDYEITWVSYFGYSDKSISSQYIISLFWTFQTLLTVGYGDIHPTNTYERVFGFSVMLIGGLMFGAIIAKVGGTYVTISACFFIYYYF